MSKLLELSRRAKKARRIYYTADIANEVSALEDWDVQSLKWVRAAKTAPELKRARIYSPMGGRAENLALLKLARLEKKET